MSEKAWRATCFGQKTTSLCAGTGRTASQKANYREGDKPRKFLAVAVWNYDDQCVQVWEITQKSVFDALHEITKEPDFGHPNTFDIRITRKGEGLETKYTVIPVPGPIVPDVEKAMATLSVNLDALLHATTTRLHEQREFLGIWIPAEFWLDDA